MSMTMLPEQQFSKKRKKSSSCTECKIEKKDGETLNPAKTASNSNNYSFSFTENYSVMLLTTSSHKNEENRQHLIIININSACYFWASVHSLQENKLNFILSTS